MILAIQISGLNSSNFEDAVLFIGSKLIMLDKDIRRALKIPGFYFYSYNFIGMSLVGYTFTVTGTNFTERFYVNINSAKLHVPVNGNQGDMSMVMLKAGDYVLKSAVNLSNVAVYEIIQKFIANRHLYEWGPPVAVPDFNNDFLNYDYF